ncbi:MAG: hypothetical protein ABUL67_00345 [Haliangium ochraceum]
MLQRVGLGQVRFNVPGLGADSRGVVVGRQLVLRFSSMDRLVSFLRLWSGDQVLDDLQPGLRLVQVRTVSGTREALVAFPVPSLSLADIAARAARTVGGQCFTGAGKHFVQYRDSRAPLGYDVAALDPADDATDFVLYGADHTLAYATVGDLPLDKLLLRLDLRRQHGNAPIRRDVLLLTVRRGLGPLVMAYLYRAERLLPELHVSAALCEPPSEGTFQRGSAFWILRLENLSPRLLGVLSRTPGLTLFAPVTGNVAIAVGYRHPIHLESCKHAFPLDRMFLFRAPPDGVTAIAPAPVFSPVADLVRLPPVQGETAGLAAGLAGSAGVPGPAAGAGRLLVAAPRPVDHFELTVPLRLEPASAGMGRAVATIVPWKQFGWLRSLCYALPSSALRGYRLALLERGLLVVAPDALDGFPFGQLLYAPAAGLLVPLGWQLRPAVSPQDLANRVRATGGALVVFPGVDQPPFRVPPESIETLEARALADPRLDEIPLEETLDTLRSRDEPMEIEVENQPLGPMPLW